MSDDAVVRLWPRADPTPLDQDALAEAYAVDAAPHLRANFVTSVDGAVELEGFSAGLSSAADKRVFAVLRMLCDALLVGAGTLRHESYRAVRLNEQRRGWRERHGLPPYPMLAVVSGRLDLDPAQAVFADAPVRPLVYTHAHAPDHRRAALAAVAEVVTVGETAVDLKAVVADLHARGATRILSEGGPHLFGALTADDLVDEVCLSVSPLLAGAGGGRITQGPPSPPRALSLRHVLAAEGMLLLRYERKPQN
jgi:riboflavin biosynthesis pyrimidine reductase